MSHREAELMRRIRLAEDILVGLQQLLAEAPARTAISDEIETVSNRLRRLREQAAG